MKHEKYLLTQKVCSRKKNKSTNYEGQYLNINYLVTQRESRT